MKEGKPRLEGASLATESAEPLGDLLKERLPVLEEVGRLLFRARKETEISEGVLKKLAVQLQVCARPELLASAERLKGSVADLERRFGEADVVQEEETGERVRKCPISLAEIEKPWKGVCGHVFEEAVVLDYLKRREECPVFGCRKKLLRQKD